MNQWNIQRAIFARLQQYVALEFFVGDRIYDDVPEDEVFPYVVVGDDDSTEYNDDVVDGSDSEITIHVWDRPSPIGGGPQGRMRTKRILQTIYDALNHHRLKVEGSATILLYAEYQTTMKEPDGKTQHGVLRFRLLSQFTTNYHSAVVIRGPGASIVHPDNP